MWNLESMICIQQQTHLWKLFARFKLGKGKRNQVLGDWNHNKISCVEFGEYDMYTTADSLMETIC